MRSTEIMERLEQLRAAAPLVQNITNFVAMNSSANALLALGASPAMVHGSDEVEDFLGVAAALVVNIGTLSSDWVAGMRLAAIAAGRLEKPWVLDPVGVGATRYRTRVAEELLALRPTVLRGNASEILALAGGEAPKGVDSRHGVEAAEGAARQIAARHGITVAVTGAVDLVTDGTRLARIHGGHPMMGRVTGLGCSASATIGAFLGTTPADAFGAAVAGLAVFGAAGKAAAERSAGPGSLQLNLFDDLYRCDLAMLEAHARVQ
jgi:hydroxyethylthiazole kinase